MTTRGKVAVIGAGSWGTAVANLFADTGHDVSIWGRNADHIRSIHQTHENKKYLPGVALNPSLKGEPDLAAALDGAGIVVCSVPTQQIRNVFGPHAARLQGKIVVNTSKGIEIGTDACVSEIFRELCPRATYVVLSGPSFALEVAKRLPTAVTLASTDSAAAEELQRALATPYFRAYTSKDVAGVELGGALKNVIAIASGMVSGLQLGYNAQAAVINRGIVEIARMGKTRGCDPMTFLGLAGMGDLILTCTGPLSRNRRVGVMLGEGKNLADIERDLGGVAEGVYTCKSAMELSRKQGVPMPITEQIYGILYEGKSLKQAVTALMSRDPKAEWDMG